MCVRQQGEKNKSENWVYRCRRKETFILTYGPVVCSTTSTQKRSAQTKSQTNYFRCTFLERYPCTPFLSPTWKHNPHNTQDSSSRAKEFKASSDVYSVKQSAWGGEMDANLPAVLSHCSSCQQTKPPQIQLVYGDWHLSLWDLGKHNTAPVWLTPKHFCLVASTSRMNVAEVRTVQTPTLSWEVVWLKGCFTGDRQLLHVLHRRRQRWRSAPVTPVMSWSLRLVVDGCWRPTWV